MYRRIVSVVFIVGLLAACLVPATSYGENPWDPDSPSGGGRGQTVYATASSSNGNTVEGAVTAKMAEDQKTGYRSSPPQQPEVRPQEKWWDWVKSYLQRLFVLLDR